jgi:hypothetical protein
MKKIVEVTVDNSVISVKINGKPIKKSYANALAKAQETEFWVFYNEGRIVKNPFSSDMVELTAFQTSLYKWLIRWYARYEHGVLATPISTYDNMKYLFLEIDPKAYMALLD